jgi:hypothetical protein
MTADVKRQASGKARASGSTTKELRVPALKISARPACVSRRKARAVRRASNGTKIRKAT